MRVCMMIEGQEDVTWDQWLALALACEEHGLDGLFRSDHYAPIGSGPGSGSLDAWAVLTALAARTERIRLGTLVSPVTFRHPSVLAKMAVTADHASSGRIEVGMGAGWYHADHQQYGFPFPDTPTRMRMLAEQLEIVHRQWSEEEFSFQGQHYRLEGCRALPKPVQQPHPPVIVGGAAGPGSARLAALWADEYNTVFSSAAECERRRGVVAEAWERADRDPASLRFSVMTGCIVGTDRAELLERARRVQERRRSTDDPSELLRATADEWITGTVDEVVTKLHALEAAGVDRVMLQHLAHADVEMVALIGREVVPAVA
ncbi:MAG: TIGR03560 family F420-dependent LLM class oxidoreductase [Actinomycetota bacterium]|nr:TIGR03560 family F420-dependent LLM class oxidoreductase [Actinomycetota bacterium]